jgi:endonuclease YncB( thermonuclease family)
MSKKRSVATPPETLEAAEYDSVPAFSLRGYRTRAKCVRVYDGDTAHFVFSMPGHGVGPAALVRERCRLAGYNTAEMKGATAEERAAAIAAKTFLEETILRKILDVEFGDYDLYGRPLLTVWVVGDSETSPITLDEHMISAGHARAYTGRGEKAWKPIVQK